VRLSLCAGAAAGVLGLAFAAPAAAQDAPQEDEPTRVRRDVSVVASRLEDAPASAVVRVVTREEIDALPGARSVPDILRSVLGVDVRRRGPGGVQADVGIRGADFNGTLVLVDGQPANDPQSNHLSFDVDVPVAAIERIEVLAGPGSAVWGSAAVGGAVNIVTRGASLGRAAVQLEARYAHGTQSLDQGGGRLAVRVAEPVTVGVDWSRAETAGFRDDTESATDLLRVSGRWDTGRGPVTLGLGIARRAFGAYAFYGTAYPNQQESTRTRTATLAGALTLGAFTLSPAVFLRAHHDDFVLERTNPAFYENRHDTVTSSARMAATHAALGGSVALGVEGGRDAVRSTNLGDHGRARGAVFAEFARPWDGAAPGQEGFRAGLRADAIEGFGSRVSPYAGATWQAFSGLTLRASFGTSFRAPTFTELYYRDPQTAGNAALAPETAWTADAGLGWAAGGLDLDVGYFHRNATNLIDFVRTASDAVFRARNVREAVTDGIEVSAAWGRGRPSFLSVLSVQAAWIFADLAALSAAAGGATQGRYVLDPLHVKADAVVGLALPASLGLNVRATYLSRPSFVDGVWLFSARLSWQAFEGRILEFFVESENLGDARYEEVPGVPLPGRTALAGFNVTW
jgi:iron complex outermembrane receptor protein